MLRSVNVKKRCAKCYAEIEYFCSLPLRCVTGSCSAVGVVPRDWVGNVIKLFRFTSDVSRAEGRVVCLGSAVP